MKKIFKSVISSMLIIFTLSSTALGAAATAAIDAGKELASKIDIEDVKKVTAEVVSNVANEGVEKGKELIDELDSEYSDDLKQTEAKTKSLWQSFVDWIKEAFNYLMHLFLFDSKDNLIGTLNQGIEKQNKEATSSVLDDITNIANNRIANAELENLNINSIDRITTKLPVVELSENKSKDSKKDKEKEEKPKEEERVKKSVEEILAEATKKTEEATKEDIKAGVDTITDTVSKIGENIETVGETVESFGDSIGAIGDALNSLGN